TTTMTVYSCSISSTPADAAGNVTTSINSERINDTGSNFVSSEDFAETGPTVIDAKTGARRAVHSEADLQPTDMVDVGGIPMTVEQARAAGVKISVERRSADEVLAKAPGSVDDADEGSQQVDTHAHQDGHASEAEAVAFENVVQAVGLHTGLDAEATIELGAD